MLEPTDEIKALPHYLSLGAGVQSSTLALMYAAGELEPMPKAAIFADTQAEPASVYRWLDWLEKQLPYPVHRVTAGSLTEMALQVRTTKDGRKYSRTAVPSYTLDPDTGQRGNVGVRTCTRDFKLRPLIKKQRELAQIQRGEKNVRCVSVIGISLDEIKRMKPSREPWVACRWPLIEHRITRQQCLEWMTDRGYPDPPRSACVYCPWHSNAEWRRLQTQEPAAFLDAVEFEKQLQRVKQNSDNFDSVPYLHPSCKPLDEIDFRSDVERGQMLLWDDECEGMCGV